jgi:hypothetical protein
MRSARGTGEAIRGLPLVPLITELFGLIAAKIQTPSSDMHAVLCKYTKRGAAGI